MEPQTEDIVTQIFHPSIETIADLQGGNLDARQADDTASHLAKCPACAALRASLDNVCTVLADEGQDSWPIPTTVAGQLDAALHDAALHDAARSDSDGRSPGTGQPPRRRFEHRTGRRGRLILIAAATAVLVAAGGSWLAFFTGPDGGPARSTSARAAGVATRTQPAAGLAPQSRQQYATPLAGSGLGVLASRLANGRATATPIKGRCAIPTTGTGSVVSLIRWHGSEAVLSVGSHTATVHACTHPGRVLAIIHF